MTRQIGPQGKAIVTQFLVAPSSEEGYYTTIQEAITAAEANGGGTVGIKVGTYVENLTFTTGTVDLVAINPMGTSGQTGIVGIHTPPAAGHLVVNGLQLTSATHIFSSAAAGTATISLIDCSFTITNGYVLNLLNWAPTGIFSFTNTLENASVNSGGINNTGGATLYVNDSGVGAGTNVMTLSGTSFVHGSVIGCPVNNVGTANFSCTATVSTGSFTFSANSNGLVSHCTLLTSASQSIIMSSAGAVSVAHCVLDGTGNCVDGAGAGTLDLADIVFLGSSTIASTLALGYPECYLSDPEFRQVTKLRGVTAFTGSEEFRQQAAVQTVDATVTTIASQVVAEGVAITLQGTMIAAQSDHSNSLGGDYTITARRAVAGNVTIVGVAITNVNSSSAATFTCDVDVPTQSVRIRVTGVAATTYNWAATYSYAKMLTNA